MGKRNLVALSVFAAVWGAAVCLIAWAPWITEEYAYASVMEHLGGPDAPFIYLGETMPLKDVPKTFKKLPFVSLVYFPDEAMFIVTFFGSVI